MVFWAIVAATVAALWALAWWSSGRARGLGRRRDMSEAEKDHLSRGMGRGFSSGGGGGR